MTSRHQGGLPEMESIELKSKDKQMKTLQIGQHAIGNGRPCFVIAEIGINHNGDLEIAKGLIDAAVAAGCDAVKFQKRTPDICVPYDQRGVERDTPWGRMTYLDYRHRVEFDKAEYDIIDAYCRERDILWSASCWDVPSVDFIVDYQVPFLKLSSAALTDNELVKRHVDAGIPTLVSTGMSTWEEVQHAAQILGDRLPWMFLHCTSTYPAIAKECNLRMINTLRDAFARPVGYSGHEVGLQISVAAVALGAAVLERHITLDRAMWGTDQSASVEPAGLNRLVRDVRVVEQALGDGIKKVYESEEKIRKKLRRQ
jgi:N-acetylneuraminate synthase